MKYRIADIVRFEQDDASWLVIATKECPLTSGYLNTLRGEVFIKGIKEIADSGVIVTPGFDYVIAKLITYKGKYAVLDGELNNCFEEDMWQ
jgi:hypothetical protein